MAQDKPNILLIITDQQRVDTLGFMGKTDCRTPSMDRLAREGISFDRGMTSSPLCCPARASIFSGMYPHQVDMMHNDSTLRAEPALANSLREKGYSTMYAGKWHLQPDRKPDLDMTKEENAGRYSFQKTSNRQEGRNIFHWFDRATDHVKAEYIDWCKRNGLPKGFPYADPELRTKRVPAMSIPKTKVMDLEPDQTIDGWIAGHALRFLKERPPGAPFFLVLAFEGPHPPFKVPEPYYSMYEPSAIPEPPNFQPTPNKPRSNTTSFYHQLWLDHGDNWEAWQKTVAAYWGFVTMIDSQVGRILNYMEKESLMDDTFIIFTADHGEMLGRHGLWHKMMPYEDAIRVPLIMRFPGSITPGIRSTAASSLVDITPTILSVLGARIPDEMEGRDLSPAFSDGKEFQADPFRFSEHRTLGDWHHAVEWRLVTDNRYKYVWNQGDSDELYNLEKDQYELNNLINDAGETGRLVKLRKRLHCWMKQTSDYLLSSFVRETGDEFENS